MMPSLGKSQNFVSVHWAPRVFAGILLIHEIKSYRCWLILTMACLYVVPFQVLQLRPKSGVRGLHKSLTDVALEHHEECDCVCRGHTGG